LKSLQDLKERLLVLQLKQIFYSVSNLHEVETFFNAQQTVFNVEAMLKENDQSIREMYSLLEVKHRQQREVIELEREAVESEREKNLNLALSVVASLGVFTFLKDVLPFCNDLQYPLFYKGITFILTLSAITALMWLYWKSRRKK
jgi:hypothetical protein